MANDTGSMIGIDLGTSNSVAAHAAVQGQPPRVLDNQVNESSTPSVVSVKTKKDKREMLVGSPALANQMAAPRDTIWSIKRLMGRGYSDKEVARVRERVLYKIVPPELGTEESLRVEMGGTKYSPTQISAMILKRVKEGAEHRLTRPVTHAVITVPAYFSEIQCRATREAGREAGLGVIQLLKEPTAAGIAYERELDDGTPKTLLVYDLGGGTFDVSILTYTNGTFTADNLEGDMWLGGDDFDALLEKRVLEKIKTEHGFDPRASGVWSSTRQQSEFFAALREHVHKAKHTLSVAESADVDLSGRAPDGASIEVSVEKKEFEELIEPLIVRTHDLVTKALRGNGSGITEQQVDWVILAGNTTTVPAVQRSMERRFGVNKLLRSVHPKHCVAMGAALIAAGASGVVCGECGQVNALGAQQCANGNCKARLLGKSTSGRATDVREAAPFAYGIQAIGDKFVGFVNKSDPLPTDTSARKVRTLRTTQPGQRIMSYLRAYPRTHRFVSRSGSIATASSRSQPSSRTERISSPGWRKRAKPESARSTTSRNSRRRSPVERSTCRPSNSSRSTANATKCFKSWRNTISRAPSSVPAPPSRCSRRGRRSTSNSAPASSAASAARYSRSTGGSCLPSSATPSPSCGTTWTQRGAAGSESAWLSSSPTSRLRPIASRAFCAC